MPESLQFNPEQLQSLRAAVVAAGTNHYTYPRVDHCQLVRQSGTQDEGLLKSEAFLRDAVDIEVVTLLSVSVLGMLDLIEKSGATIGRKKNAEQPAT